VCTLTFVPGLPLGGYLLAHNRDESLKRGPGQPPVIGRLGAARIMAPRDIDAGGTWLGVDSRGRCLAILNGDRTPAVPAPADARSRGLLLVDLLADARPAAVRAHLERQVAEGSLRSRPFKLVVVEPVVQGAVGIERGLGAAPPQARLLRIDWDGERLAFAELSGAQCIVSSTFESDAVGAARCAAFTQLLASLPREEDLLRARFAAPASPLPAGTSPVASHPAGPAGSARAPEDLGWITDPAPVAAALRTFHAGHEPSAPQGDAFSVCMHRPDARTVSRTLLVVGPREIRMEYTPGWPCAGAEAVVATMERQFR